MPAWTLVMVSEEVVAPEMQLLAQAPLLARLTKPEPESTCHWKVVAPEITGAKVTFVPGQALTELMVMEGEALIVTFAVEVTEQVPSTMLTERPTVPEAPAV